MRQQNGHEKLILLALDVGIDGFNVILNIIVFKMFGLAA
jgi:hypothetical protein